MIEPERRSLATGNGRAVQATFYAPAVDCRASVLLVGAMGVNQDYYAAIATWLAQQGYLAATFDFFGVGRSLRGSLRHVEVNILQWAQFDCSAMIDALCARQPGKPLFWIGHSLGAQILPFTSNWAKISRAVFIASGSGYWREHPPPLRRRAIVLWFFLVPLFVSLLGYFPGRRLRTVGDLPGGVIRQWRRWCLDPQYAAGAEGSWARERYAAVGMAITSISFTDDEFMSARNTASLEDHYVHAAKSVRRIAPQDLGVSRIGHFGFFREQFREKLWERCLLPELRLSSPAACDPT
ncbi:MAG TPA: alpha/beta fold hydrolase [Burkholderiaceae bacterium]|nr:alpha/beta fold hydrolase [Burkholderiaceae bacterium]